MRVPNSLLVCLNTWRAAVTLQERLRQQIEELKEQEANFDADAALAMAMFEHHEVRCPGHGVVIRFVESLLLSADNTWFVGKRSSTWPCATITVFGASTGTQLPTQLV